MLILSFIFIVYIIVITTSIYFDNRAKIYKEIESKNETENKSINFNGTLNKKLLTNCEYEFYKKLKQITDKYNLTIFSKVRLADIIRTENYSDFNKVRSKHIDFVICDTYTNFLVFIELDDYTHNYYKNYKNDIIKDEIFDNFNLKIYRIKINEEENKLNKLDEVFKNKYIYNKTLKK